MEAVHISGPQSLLPIVPHLLGFQPENSIVVLFLSGKSLVCTARVDADADALDMIRDATTAVELQVGPPIQRIIVSYTDEPPNAADYDGALDILHVKGDRYWSVLCDNEGCCPPEGKRFTETGAATQLRVEGFAPLESRRAIEALAEPGEVIHAAAAQGQRLAVRTDVRDELWRMIDALTDVKALRKAGEDWLAVARHAGTDAAPAYFLAGWAFFRLGDGACANIAVDNALRLDPEYGAAKLLRAALANGVNGTQMPRLTAPPTA